MAPLLLIASSSSIKGIQLFFIFVVWVAISISLGKFRTNLELVRELQLASLVLFVLGWPDFFLIYWW